ncbi:MAG: hypothetical protein ABIH57_01390, partial [Candidatus Omnitrophota bacterium]
REEEPKLLAEEIIPLEEVKSKFTKAILIKLATPGLEKSTLDELKNILTRHKGKVPVMINFQEPSGRRTSISTGRDYTVKPDGTLLNEIENLCGTGSIRIRT